MALRLLSSEIETNTVRVKRGRRAWTKVDEPINADTRLRSVKANVLEGHAAIVEHIIGYVDISFFYMPKQKSTLVNWLLTFCN